MDPMSVRYVMQQVDAQNKTKYSNSCYDPEEMVVAKY
jgi:hypothetical protein